jgi:hypothetical protein
VFELQLLTLLFVKHFICDFPLQAHPYQYLNKGTYGHPGGILHAGIHMAGTLLAMWCTTGWLSLSLSVALVDGLIHYHIDWAKMNIGKKYDLKPTNSEGFWILLGLDQLLHALTYIGIVVYLVKS